MDGSREEVAQRLHGLLSWMDGTEIGNLEQVTGLLTLAGLTYEVHGDTVYVTSADEQSKYVVQLRSRQAMSRWGRGQGASVTMPEDGDKFAPINRVAAAMLAATVGDPVRGAGTPAVWVEQHVQRVAFLKGGACHRPNDGGDSGSRRSDC